jgi:Tat protein translocase TatC
MADANQPQLEDKNKPEVEDELAGSEAPLLEHLIELRKRLIKCAIAIVVLMIGCFLISKNIFDVLLGPYRGVYSSDPTHKIELIYTAPQELFFTELNLAFFGAIFLGFPFIATQIYLFMAPGLYKHERKALVPYLIATPVFFVLGALMVYFTVLPMALHFFAGMETQAHAACVRVSRIRHDAYPCLRYLLPAAGCADASGADRSRQCGDAEEGASLRHRRHFDRCGSHYAARSDFPDRACPADVRPLRTGNPVGSDCAEAP